MFTRLASRRGWAFALLVSLAAVGSPSWAANCSPKARITPTNAITVPELTNGVPTVVTVSDANSTPNNKLTFAWSVVTPTTPAGLAVTFNSPVGRTRPNSARNSLTSRTL